MHEIQKVIKMFTSKMMSWLLLLTVAEVKKKRGEWKIDGFRKKLMIPEFEIPERPEHEVKWKIGNIFVNEKILEEYSVKIYKTDPYFYEYYKENIKVDKNGYECILCRTDVYFTEYLLAGEIDENKICWDRPYFWGEKKKSPPTPPQKKKKELKDKIEQMTGQITQ